MNKIVSDLQYLLGIEKDDKILTDIISLWDDKEKLVKHGVSYREDT